MRRDEIERKKALRDAISKGKKAAKKEKKMVFNLRLIWHLYCSRVYGIHLSLW